MKADDRIDRNRRQFLQAASRALAAGLVLPYGASALGDTVRPEAEQIAQFANAVKGTVIPRHRPVYEAWRRSMIWNYRKFDRHPDLIVQAEDEQDVVETVEGTAKGDAPRQLDDLR